MAKDGQAPSPARYPLLLVFLVVLALNLWIFRYFLVTG